MAEQRFTRRQLTMLGAGAGAMTAGFKLPVQSAGAAPSLPWFDVRDFGATPDDATDDTAAVQAAVDAATAATSGGVVLLPPGTFHISGPIIVNASKKAHIIGAGMWRSRFLCTSANAGLRFGDTPGGANGAQNGRSGGFWIDGGDMPSGDPVLMNVGVATNHDFFDIMLTNSLSAGTALLLERTQNSLFTNLHVNSCNMGVVLDYGAGGNSFVVFTFRGNVTNLTFRNSWNGLGPPPEFRGTPENNKFFGGTIEGGSSEPTVLQVDHGAGGNNAFIGTGFAGNGHKIKYYHADETGEKTSSFLHLINCIFVDDTGIEQTARFSTVYLRDCMFRLTEPALTVADDCYIEDEGSLYGVTDRFANALGGTATEDQLVGHETFHLHQFTAPSADNIALRTVLGNASNRAGDPFFEMKASGEMAWGSGDADPDVTLRRAAAGQLAVDGMVVAEDGVGVGNSSPGTSVGNVVRKVQVFDASGTPLGWVPVYDSIG